MQYSQNPSINLIEAASQNVVDPSTATAQIINLQTQPAISNGLIVASSAASSVSSLGISTPLDVPNHSFAPLFELGDYVMQSSAPVEGASFFTQDANSVAAQLMQPTCYPTITDPQLNLQYGFYT